MPETNSTRQSTPPIPFAMFGVREFLMHLGMDPNWAQRAQEARIEATGDDFVFLNVKFACPVLGPKSAEHRAASAPTVPESDGGETD